ncbi:cobalt-precorrin 5A hydrolase [Clostridium acetobutylicum]|uniref:Cobalamin biosynthesis protein CbiG n=1 Tax=Clostridium acetobutylicum (strain ATCC 824 / DSM 792 / JCM 1419 / IAM 19013 / LMG 5710 / NBRC 13948 / NRRL B-527 / VKM B-1787 / 2291 / W) TaxID=272562 RepID=Q97JB6_CLOAB|nr:MULTISPECIES: cobalt-precorrin 5A hydrolase [Clostridium]AAK79338.1 Cobalamin biosynthesis protein CbiG [Clostridium acetobutylicum ATCC 824]ADZ20421.1 cobalamin biosynthesis protein CbiG [Clostridium acetobutylicum EA 2018]AEI33649.1 cobalamin biosynthesis protein CbiG [Clostridium acetobutylicum DSM 1731]AWV81413.1 cobalt-precorrin 5A hydrolase [Clostridium acetobutylicum]MBC2393048.1 cobalt-precorrin 5A hydrolase [Clostridium acetobutylicum]
MNTALISLNSYGDKIGKKLRQAMDLDIYSKREIENFKLSTLTEMLINRYEALIFVASTGIAVRAIAPFIKSKTEDPAIIVVDVLSKYTISLLSGHIGRANEMTLKISKILGSIPIITTATDNLNVEAPDAIAVKNGLIIDDLKKAKEISSLLIKGSKVSFIDEENLIKCPKGYTDSFDSEGKVYVTNKLMELKEKELRLIRKNVILGIGCRKNYSVEAMENIVMKKLRELGIDKRAVKTISSIDIKANEKAIIHLSEVLKADFKTFTKEEIKTVQEIYEGSDFVEKNVGVRSVCEPCVKLSNGQIVFSKMKINGMTLCIGYEKVKS